MYKNKRCSRTAIFFIETAQKGQIEHTILILKTKPIFERKKLSEEIVTEELKSIQRIETETFQCKSHVVG